MKGLTGRTFLKRSIASVQIFLRGFSASLPGPTYVIIGGFFVLAFSAAYLDSAFAQATINSDDGPELRSLYANSEDVAGGKRLAKSSCASCHGINGISSNPGVPHLAGQRPAYLYQELKAYQARDTNAMHNEVGFLNDDAMIKLAAYYASLDPPQPSAANAENVPATDPVQAGKAAAAGCAGCHGDGGVSKTAGVPSLVGSDPKALVNAMKAYKNGERKNDTMKSMLASVVDAGMNNIALYYGVQKAARAQTPVAGDKAAAVNLAAGCEGCHGPKGVSGNPLVPSLAGQDSAYLASAMQAYKRGTRSDDTMKGLVASLDDNTMKNLAAYFATQEPKEPNFRLPLKVNEWAQRCDRCHGANGNSTDPRIPALAAQRVDYLEKVLHDYRLGARKSSAMAAMSEILTEHDVENIAAYYARQTPRPVVFVIIPPK
jgi:cytochrome c553